MSSNFGHLFRISTFGESHGGAVGVVVDGCPPRIPIDVELIQKQLARRRPGQSSLTTARQEPDQVEILSGVFEGETLGSPIALVVKNKDARSDDYKDFKDIYRPSHADYTYEAKYGTRNWKGGGRTSARETIGRVAAGALARHFLKLQCGAEVVAWVEQIGEINLAADAIDLASVNEEQVEATPVRCPDPAIAKKMIARIEEIKAAGDSLGGVIRCIVRNVPPGLGEPVFDRLEADLAKACLSLPATKGFEIGSGFAGTRLLGSAHNDPFVPGGEDEPRPSEMARDERPPLAHTSTNYSGGIQGGISNGEMIDLRIAFKPTATIFKTQQSVNAEGQAVEFKPKGRHDPCVLPRAVPMVEAMVGLVLADHYLRHVAQNCLPPSS